MVLLLWIPPTTDQKYSRKKIPESSSKQNFVPATTINIYMVLGIISNLEMIENVQEDMHDSYANTTPYYIRDLSIHRFWYPREIPGANAPMETEGQL